VDKAHTVAEGAGGASLAAASKIKSRLKGKKVGLILSGGNITYENLMKCLAD
jgi:threonine dehydratase